MMQHHTYSPVRIETKRSNSDSASNSSYSTSESSSSIPSPEDETTEDPFALDFSLKVLALEDQPQEYFPTQPMAFALPSLARTPKSASGRIAMGLGGGRGDDDEEGGGGGGWEPEGGDGATPRFEAPPSLASYSLNSNTPTPSIETAPRTSLAPEVSPTSVGDGDVVDSPSSSSSSTTPIDPPPTNPVPLPHLHLIPRPPPTPAQRKYSSSLLSATQRLLEISLSPNPSPSDPAETSYFSISDTAPLNPRKTSSSHSHSHGSDWSPALSVSPTNEASSLANNSRRSSGGGGGGGPNEDGVFALEDEGSYERRFSRLRREADARSEALRALREEAGGENWGDEEAEEWEQGEVVIEDSDSSAPPFWDEDEEEGHHHVEYSGYP